MTKDEFKVQLAEILKEKDVASGLMHEDWDEDLFPDMNLEVVEAHGGEDEGSDYYTVLKFTKADATLYVKFQGWYASHYGSEYQEYSFVEPKLVQVIEYR